MRSIFIMIAIAVLFGINAEAVEVNQWYKMNIPVSAAFYSIHVTDSSNIFAGTSGKIYRSSDTGNTWQILNTGLASTKILSFLSKSNGSSNVIFAGSEGLIYRSVDNGNTWMVIKNDISALKVVKMIFNKDKSIIYAALKGASSGGIQGVVKSTDNGNSWTECGSELFGTNIYDIAFDTSGCLYAATDKGVFKYNSDATGWMQDCLQQYAVTKLVLTKENNLLIATSTDGLYLKNNSTGELNKFNNGLKFNYATGLFVDSDDDLWAYSIDGLLAYNSHANNTWAQNISGLDNAQVAAFAEYPGKIIVLATNNGIYTNKYIAQTPNNGIVESESNMLTISPIPADNYINISSDNLNLITAQIKIYDNNGALQNIDLQKNASDKQLQINTSSLSNGVYIIELNWNGKIYTKKIVISR